MQIIVDIKGKRVDVGKALVEKGYVFAEKRTDQNLQDLVSMMLIR